MKDTSVLPLKLRRWIKHEGYQFVKQDPLWGCKRVECLVLCIESQVPHHPGHHYQMPVAELG